MSRKTMKIISFITILLMVMMAVTPVFSVDGDVDLSGIDKGKIDSGYFEYKI